MKQREIPQAPIVTRMQDEDLDAVIEFGLSTPELQTGTGSPQFYSKETLSRWINSPNGILLIAKVDGQFAGFSITAYNPDSRDGYIHCITTVDTHRGTGLGRRLLEQTLSQLEHVGCNHVYCLVRTNNKKTQSFFKKNGFEIGKAFHYVERMLPRP